MSSPTLRDALPVWARIGFLSFGGPAAQIALMHRVVVDEKGWLDEKQYLNALSFCMLLPGPEAMQLATYVGWRMNGVAGGLLAGLLFVLPGAGVILALSAIYAAFGNVPLLQGVFLGVKAAVLIIVLEALLRVARKGLTEGWQWVVAGLAFVSLFLLNLPFPLVILAAGLFGFLTAKEQVDEPVLDVTISPARTLRTVLMWLAIWWVPIWAVASLSGTLGEIGVFFSKLATVTFGGAYAVLAYMAQDAVQVKGWLSAPEMLDGLGLAETTPGPLILVTEFVGYLAAARESGTHNFTAGLAGAVVTLWATFAPCFLWVFAGAPYVDWIGTKHRLRGALSAISAAVVGVILNLSLWFALHVFFDEVARVQVSVFTFWRPDLSSISLAALVLALIAGVLLLRLKFGVLITLAISAVFGTLAHSLIG